MRFLRNAVVASAAAFVIGTSGAAFAQPAQTHVMTVRLPDGGLAQIRYTGNVAPRVSFSEGPAPIGVFAPMPALFGPDSPLATLDRISAQMDRQAAAMFRRAEALSAEAQSGRLTEAAMRNLPPGSSSYTFVSSLSGNGVCSQSLEITSQGNGTAPRVVRHSSGHCGAVNGTGAASLPTTAPAIRQPGPVWTSVPAPQRSTAPTRPDVLWTSAHGATPYAGLVKEIPAAVR